MKKAKSLIELAQSLEEMRKNSKDYSVPVGKMRMDGDANLVFHSNDGPLYLKPNDWSHQQISGYTEIPKAYYDRIRGENKQLLADNVNHGLNHFVDDTRMVRTVGDNVRAFVSSKYRRLDSYDLLNEVLPVMLDKQMTVESAEITEKRTYIKALLPKLETEIKKGDPVQYGLVISNSDVGAGSLRVEPLIYRLVCLNGLITSTALRKFHVGKSQSEDDVYELLTDETKNLTDAAFWAQVKDVVLASMNPEIFQKAVDKLRLAANEPIRNFDLPRVVELTMRSVGISGEDIKNNITAYLANGADGAGLTRWGLINGFTSAASSDNVNYDQSVDLERAGAKILDLTMDQWEVISSTKK